MKSIKNNQDFKEYSTLNSINTDYLDVFFSNDLLDVLKGEKSLFIKRDSDGLYEEVELDDVLYDENHTSDMNSLNYEFHFKVPFGGDSMFSILVSKIEHSSQVVYPDSIYWLYSNVNFNPDYKFMFKHYLEN